ncbi:hypothetical protein NDU88_009322 [Pleurodeles waltl]|uniref:Uncharacterized protein n=1 Tax=Pleurodeles waltl TaxID=8319 RepID=A0AAV7PYP6_PLEWA|nr:hypothetical protein NDU88_009322 [Pleurodeles waltl]
MKPGGSQVRPQPFQAPLSPTPTPQAASRLTHTHGGCRIANLCLIRGNLSDCIGEDAYWPLYVKGPSTLAQPTNVVWKIEKVAVR